MPKEDLIKVESAATEMAINWEQGRRWVKTNQGSRSGKKALIGLKNLIGRELEWCGN